MLASTSSPHRLGMMRSVDAEPVRCYYDRIAAKTGHPTNYEPDSVKLQAYYSDVTQLVLLNPRFA
jgi:hypothetical protein